MPIDRGIIDQQLEALGEGSRWWERRELRDLPVVLHAEEHILAISRGKLARVRWLRRPWLIVVTDRRLLCLRSGSSGWRQVEVPAAIMGRVALRIGPFHGRVVVVAGGEKYRLLVPREDAYKIFSALSGLSHPQKQSDAGFAPTRMVRRMMDHVLALPAVALGPTPPEDPPAPAPDTTEIRQRLESLENEVQELRQQVAFLEQLLQQRHAGSATSDIFSA